MPEALEKPPSDAQNISSAINQQEDSSKDSEQAKANGDETANGSLKTNEAGTENNNNSCTSAGTSAGGDTPAHSNGEHNRSEGGPLDDSADLEGELELHLDESADGSNESSDLPPAPPVATDLSGGTITSPTTLPPPPAAGGDAGGEDVAGKTASSQVDESCEENVDLKNDQKEMENCPQPMEVDGDEEKNDVRCEASQIHDSNTDCAVPSDSTESRQDRSPEISERIEKDLTDSGAPQPSEDVVTIMVLEKDEEERCEEVHEVHEPSDRKMPNQCEQPATEKVQESREGTITAATNPTGVSATVGVSADSDSSSREAGEATFLIIGSDQSSGESGGENVEDGNVIDETAKVIDDYNDDIFRFDDFFFFVSFFFLVYFGFWTNLFSSV